MYTINVNAFLNNTVSLHYNNKVIPISFFHPLYHCCHWFHLCISIYEHIYDIYIACIMKYIDVIIFNKLLPIILRIKNISVLISPLFFLLCSFFLYVNPRFFIYIIFFFLKKLLLTFLARQIYWQQILTIFVCLRTSLFHHFWRLISQGIVFWVYGCFPSKPNILLYSLLAWIVLRSWI